MRVHTSKKPFRCTHAGCSAKFTQKSTLIKPHENTLLRGAAREEGWHAPL